jgi:hypothetical protein
MQYVDRYVPANTNQGWGIAAFIVLLALACVATATVIHKKTYKHPTDVTWHAKGVKERGGMAAANDSLGPNAAGRHQGTPP